MADVVVIGAGAIGMSCAWALVRRGASVTVLESSTRLGEDTAAGSGGVITPSHCIPLAGPRVLRGLPRYLLGLDDMISVRPWRARGLASYGLRALRVRRADDLLPGIRAVRDQARASRERFAELERDGVRVGLEHRGLMNVASTPEGFEALLEEAALLEREGFAPRILRGADAVGFEPTLRDDITGGVYWDEDDHCLPATFTPALGAACRERGVELRLGTRAVGFDRDARGAVTAVRTEGATAERVPADTVVLAAGAAIRRLGRVLGLRIPVQAGKGHHVHLRDWRGALPRIPMILHERTMGATPMGSDLRLVGGMDFAGDRRTLDPRRLARIVRFAADYLRDPPTLDEGSTSSTWCGLRPCTPDGLPIVGRTKSTPNAILATGHAMNGLTLSLQTGADVAVIVLDGAADGPWLETYAPSRFGL